MNSSVSSKTSTFFIPASSDRAAETDSGQLSQVTQPLLFIMPCTARVTFDIFSATTSLDEFIATSTINSAIEIVNRCRMVIARLTYLVSVSDHDCLDSH